MTITILTSEVGIGGVGLSAIKPLAQKLNISFKTLPTIFFEKRPDLGKSEPDITGADEISIFLDKNSQNQNQLLFGYFANEKQVNAAANWIEKAQANFTFGPITIDPVMGDDDKQYISDEVRDTLINQLIPKADVITPNRFEADLIFGTYGCNFDEIEQRLKIYFANRPRPIIIITSAKVDEKIEIWYWDKSGKSGIYSHEKIDHPPRGTGDIFAFLVSVFLNEYTLNTAVEKSSTLIMDLIYQTKNTKNSPANTIYFDDVIV